MARGNSRKGRERVGDSKKGGSFLRPISTQICMYIARVLLLA